jgi:SAM-dependent methyltransferase
MKKEIDLLKNYPKTKRKTEERYKTKKDENIQIARKFGKEFFDGDRDFGYGGYEYNSKYWKDVVSDFIKYYQLDNNSSILDVGCAKGFMLFEFKKYLPNIKIRGIDISEYAINNSKEEVKKHLDVGTASNLPYEDNSYDCVISITTIHNLNREECGKSLREIERVSKKNSFITVDAYSNDYEKKLMSQWNLTALTVMHTNEWKIFFEENGYSGDYYWFKP